MREHTVIDSPVGSLHLATEDGSLTELLFSTEIPTQPPPVDDILQAAVHQLDRYFRGTLKAFELPLAPKGSDFQLRVWEQLRDIPYGTTASYADIAVRLGMPVSASRAIGLANGANPLAIVIPCHRVIGTDGSLVGYGGGLDRKRLLLDLESPAVQDTLFEG